MDAHFWPSIYPAIAIGLLLGLTYGGFTRGVLGTLGGLIGGAAAYYLSSQISIESDIASLALLIACAALGAYLLIVLGKRLPTSKV